MIPVFEIKKKQYGGAISNWEKVHEPQDGTLGYRIIGFFDNRHGAAGSTSHIVAIRKSSIGVEVETATTVFLLRERSTVSAWTPQSDIGLQEGLGRPLVRVKG